MAITGMDALVAALSAGQKRDLFKASATAEGAGTWHSLWKVAGQPVAGASPGAATGVVPTSATAGAIPFTNPSGGALSYLAQLVVSPSTVGKLILYDRLWASSGLSGTPTTDTSMGSMTALTRPDANGAGVEMWGEIYTPIGATGATLTVKYTNQAGTTGQTATYAHPANAESTGQMFPLVLAAADTGVRVPTSYSFSVSTGTAGDWGITLLRRIAELPMPIVNAGQLLDFFALGGPQVYDSACLALMVLCSTTNTGVIQGSLNLVQA